MKFNKGLRLISIISECSFLGSIVLYIYNYYISSKKYEVMPKVIKSRLDLFIIIAIISLILFLVIKYALYIKNKTNNEDVQLEMNFDENKVKEIETKYRNLEAPITERVFVYKEDYEVPRERQMICPNCSRVIDMNATICIKCGYLLKPIIQEKVVEKTKQINNDDSLLESLYDNNSTKNYYEENNYVVKHKNNRLLKNILINGSLILAIIICLILIIKMASIRGLIG